MSLGIRKIEGSNERSPRRLSVEQLIASDRRQISFRNGRRHSLARVLQQKGPQTNELGARCARGEPFS
jgi:hypothetical protein